MRYLFLAVLLQPVYVPHLQHAVGIGTDKFIPINTLEVQGNVSIGDAYSGTVNAPPNGLAIQGKVGIGTSKPTSKLHVLGSFSCTDSLQIPGPEWNGFIRTTDSDLRLHGKGILKIGNKNNSERVQLNLDSGTIEVSGYLQSDLLRGNGVRPVGADSDGRLRPIGSGLSLPSSEWNSGLSPSTPVSIQIFYGSQGIFSSWQLRNSSGQIIFSGGPGPNNAMSFQQNVALPPGNYIIQANHSNQLSWDNGWIRIVHPAGTFGPVSPGLSGQNWFLSIPALSQNSPGSSTSLAQEVIRGNVGANGAPRGGGGFSITHVTTGTYRIVFEQPYLTAPTVVLSPESSEPILSTLETVKEDEFTLKLFRPNGNLVNAPFHFWASGEIP
jgi:hypothetical protein